MKILVLSCLFIPFICHALSGNDFNRALREDLNKEIKRDDFNYKKRSSRAPASVPEVIPHQIQTPPSKVEKVRQIGPNKW